MFGQDDQNQPYQDNAGPAQPAAPVSDQPSDTPAPTDNASGAPGYTEPTASAPEPAQDAPETSGTSDNGGGTNTDLVTTSGTDDLVQLKQQALQQLSPLVDHLDQSPEEKFRTTMMMIQASDDQSLLKNAFEAAQKIGDDKERAQALLDIINEINYFTQQKAE